MRPKVVIPFVLYPILIAFLSFYGVILDVTAIFILCAGFLCVTLSEYFLHRCIFHSKILPRKLKKLISHGHVYHHRYPLKTDNLILPIFITLPVSLFFLSIYILLFGTAYCFWFYTGEVAAYFLYEFMHYTAHHCQLTLPYLKKMRQYHLEHHKYYPNKQFMITIPIWDILFKTKKET